MQTIRRPPGYYYQYPSIKSSRYLCCHGTITITAFKIKLAISSARVRCKFLANVGTNLTGVCFHIHKINLLDSKARFSSALIINVTDSYWHWRFYTKNNKKIIKTINSSKETQSK